jgi:hypothetical protein
MHSLANDCRYALKAMMVRRPDFYGQVVEGLGRQPTDEDFDRLAKYLLTVVRRGTPEEGKPLWKRMH